MTDGASLTLSLTDILPLHAVAAGRGTQWQLSAGAADRARVAQRLGLHEICRLNASGVAKWLDNNTVALEVSFNAGVLQTCVVSLDLLNTTVEDQFMVVYSRDIKPDGNEIGKDAVRGDNRATAESVYLDVMAEDPPEPLEQAGIDVADIVIQHLSLALDPYPRAEHVRASESSEVLEIEIPGQKDTAFSVLARLKTNR